MKRSDLDPIGEERHTARMWMALGRLRHKQGKLAVYREIGMQHRDRAVALFKAALASVSGIATSVAVAA